MIFNLNKLVYKLLLIICYSFLFLLFCISLFHCKIIKDFIPIYFYRGVFIILSSGFLFFFLIIILKLFKKEVNGLLSVNFILTTILIAFFGIIPVSYDRSISVFLLGYMSETGGTYSKSDINRIFNDIYITKYDAMGRRIFEQTSSGNIVELSKDCYSLTDQGKNFILLSKKIAWLFDSDPKFLEPIE